MKHTYIKPDHPILYQGAREARKLEELTEGIVEWSFRGKTKGLVTLLCLMYIGERQAMLFDSHNLSLRFSVIYSTSHLNKMKNNKFKTLNYTKRANFISLF